MSTKTSLTLEFYFKTTRTTVAMKLICHIWYTTRTSDMLNLTTHIGCITHVIAGTLYTLETHIQLNL